MRVNSGDFAWVGFFWVWQNVLRLHEKWHACRLLYVWVFWLCHLNILILDLWILFFFPWFFFTEYHHFLSFIGTKEYEFLSFFHWNITMLLSLIIISEIGICYYWEIYLLLYVCFLFYFLSMTETLNYYWNSHV